MSRRRVAVIGGGQNCEHEVSLASAAAVAAALDPLKYDVVRLTIEPDGEWSSTAGAGQSDEHGGVVGLAGAIGLLQSCEVVLPVVHGPRGEDGTLAALCELAGVAYVGSGVGAGALAMDKWVTKLVARSVGVRTAEGVVTSRSDTVDFSGPVVVKPVSAGSSHGVTLVRSAEELTGALVLALTLDDRALVEEVLVGREIDLAVLREPDGTLRIGPPLEIVVDELFDTETKYDGSADFRLPADLDGVQRKELEAAAVAMYEALGCRGVARIDFFLTEAGAVLNEVNTMPGMTEQSQVPKMFAADGLPYADLLDLLVCAAR